MRMRQDSVTALDIGVPDTVWTLLGISAVSLVGSPLIQKTQEDERPDEKSIRRFDAVQQERFDQVADGKIDKNTSIARAGLVDMFMGEHVNDADLLDMAKIQMFFFTVLLALTYGTSIATLLKTDAYPTALPDIGAGMLPLLGLSHAGYLTSKVVTA